MENIEETPAGQEPVNLSELAWVKTLVPVLNDLLVPLATDETVTHACCGEKLAYSHEIERYDANSHPSLSRTAKYETDLLVYDQSKDESWIPRVVLECKIRSITTHDALTYSSKAATHKHVHPYLRYGILIGGWEDLPLPARLVRHGAYFDFMAVLHGQELTGEEKELLGELLREEVLASRRLQGLLFDRTASRAKYRVLHRPLILRRDSDSPKHA